MHDELRWGGVLKRAVQIPHAGFGQLDPLRERAVTIDSFLRGVLVLQVCPGQKAIAAESASVISIGTATASGALSMTEVARSAI